MLLWFVITFAVITFYDVFFEVFNSGRTPGKLLNGLRVVRLEGQPVNFVTSVIRNVIRPIDFLPTTYLLGAVVILATKKNQRIGDVVAGTLIVRELGGGRRRRDAVAPAALDGRPRHRGGRPAPLGHEPHHAGGARDGSGFPRPAPIDRTGGTRRTCRTLAERLRPKLGGPPADLRGEQFLLALVRAKAGRTS